MSLENIILEIDNLKNELDSIRPIPKETLRSLEEDFSLRFTYNSNAIEGNTLTLNETKVVLEGITVGGKKLREHFETINHAEAIDWLNDSISKKGSLDERFIKELHYLVLKNIDNKNAGKYREVSVLISGASHTPPDHLHVKEEIDLMLKIYDGSVYHPLIKAGILHAVFVKIHPFIDGNGRTGRLILNYALMTSGYLPIVIEASERVKYFNALDLACAKSNYRPFLELIANLQLNSLNKYLEILKH